MEGSSYCWVRAISSLVLFQFSSLSGVALEFFLFGEFTVLLNVHVLKTWLQSLTEIGEVHGFTHKIHKK